MAKTRKKVAKKAKKAAKQVCTKQAPRVELSVVANYKGTTSAYYYAEARFRITPSLAPYDLVFCSHEHKKAAKAEVCARHMLEACHNAVFVPNGT